MRIVVSLALSVAALVVALDSLNRSASTLVYITTHDAPLPPRTTIQQSRSGNWTEGGSSEAAVGPKPRVANAISRPNDGSDRNDRFGDNNSNNNNHNSRQTYDSVGSRSLFDTTSSSVVQYDYDGFKPDEQNQGFLEWEAQSMLGMVSTGLSKDEVDDFGRCNPPPGVSQRCCVGACSGIRWECREKTPHMYRQVRALAKDHTTSLPEAALARNATQCDVCRIATMLFEHNLTMVFMGDSITRQSLFALACAWQRRGQDEYRVEIVDANVLEKEYDIEITQVSTNWMKTIKFRHVFLRPSIKDWAEPLQNADVMVVNYGLHWSKYATRPNQLPSVLEEGWNDVLRYAMNASKKFPRLLAVRETSAQAFQTLNGDFFPSEPGEINNQTECVPVKTDRFFSWRDTVFEDAMNRFKLPMVSMNRRRVLWPNTIPPEREAVILPFREYSKQLYFMHQHVKLADCTHFCYSHFLWQPLWRSLRLAMERRFDWDGIAESTT